MLITADNVPVHLTDGDVKKLAAIVGDEDTVTITKAASAALSHILDVCSTTSTKSPVLMDIHVFLASKLMQDETTPVDREAIGMVLEAWREAEGQLHQDARRALRLLEPLVMEVLHAKDKNSFETAFNEQFVPRLPLKSASFLRTYIEVMQEWSSGEGVPEDGHYLENVVSGIYRNALGTLGTRKKSDHAKKRLGAAKEALDSYLFD